MQSIQNSAVEPVLPQKQQPCGEPSQHCEQLPESTTAPLRVDWDQQPLKPMTEPCPVVQDFCPPARFISSQFYTMSRPQYKRSCGISSLVSVWNYQFSRLGRGVLQPLSVERCLRELGIAKQLEKVDADECPDENYQTNNTIVNKLDFGRFTGNPTLIAWFKLLCKKYSVRGRAFIVYAPTFSKQALCKSKEEARRELLMGLVEGRSYIYHCNDHYMCPVGYYLQEPEPSLPQQSGPVLETKADRHTQICLQQQAEPQAETVNAGVPRFSRQTTLLIADPSKVFSPFHEVSWDEIDHDLRTPYYNVRRKDRGIDPSRGRGLKQGSTNKCLICFESI